MIVYDEAGVQVKVSECAGAMEMAEYVVIRTGRERVILSCKEMANIGEAVSAHSESVVETIARHVTEIWNISDGFKTEEMNALAEEVREYLEKDEQ